MRLSVIILCGIKAHGNRFFFGIIGNRVNSLCVPYGILIGSCISLFPQVNICKHGRYNPERFFGRRGKILPFSRTAVRGNKEASFKVLILHESCCGISCINKLFMGRIVEILISFKTDIVNSEKTICVCRVKAEGFDVTRPLGIQAEINLENIPACRVNIAIFCQCLMECVCFIEITVFLGHIEEVKHFICFMTEYFNFISDFEFCIFFCVEIYSVNNNLRVESRLCVLTSVERFKYKRAVFNGCIFGIKFNALYILLAIEFKIIFVALILPVGINFTLYSVFRKCYSIDYCSNL